MLRHNDTKPDHAELSWMVAILASFRHGSSGSRWLPPSFLEFCPHAFENSSNACHAEPHRMLGQSSRSELQMDSNTFSCQSPMQKRLLPNRLGSWMCDIWPSSVVFSEVFFEIPPFPGCCVVSQRGASSRGLCTDHVSVWRDRRLKCVARQR